MSQIEKIKEFATLSKGTDLTVWRDILKDKFGISICKKGWQGVLMDEIYAMILGVESPGNKLGRDFDEFENKTLTIYNKTNGYKASGDIRISNVLYDKIRKNSFKDSNLRDKSETTIFNLHLNNKLVDFRLSSLSPDILENEYNILMQRANNSDELKINPKSRKCEYLNIKYYPTTDEYGFAWRGGNLMKICNSLIESNIDNIILNQNEYILSLIDKYGMKYITPTKRYKVNRQVILDTLMLFHGKKLDMKAMTDIIIKLDAAGWI